MPASHSLARCLELHTFDASVIQGYHSPKGELLSGERASDLIEPPELSKAIGRSEADYRCIAAVRWSELLAFPRAPFVAALVQGVWRDSLGWQAMIPDVAEQAG